ncbi:hypothetical protein K431DRAFT_281441 [Polychaeton citri CBS 116435]|uniref:HCP-like protein n=1 Tax=Polychaeton citri CBS 116435 TaxID=1314669 RepID=A0A9P4UTQ0_9PEZI|nr:hypothetical protein K431DRAFT_281441 [Polychaeton citri CBS 116435]
MPLRDLLKKKDALSMSTSSAAGAPPTLPNFPATEFKFVRTTTDNEEEIEPPSFPEENDRRWSDKTHGRKGKEIHGKLHLGFRRSSNAIYTKDPTAQQQTPTQQAHTETGEQRVSLEKEKKREHRLSSRLHIGGGRSRAPSVNTSTNLPADLPDAPETVGAEDASSKEEAEGKEARWEKRATMLAMANPLADSQQQEQQTLQEGLDRVDRGTATAATTRTRSRSPVNTSAASDISIQEAVRLHESGELTASTHMFGRLAAVNGENNPLAQVLYGLALRHGWGIEPNLEQAVQYLSLAASNSALIEEKALAESGMRKGGAAKGELVLAIFELANCFRHGWGVKKDAVAARMYYETAANLGDTDAMDEAAWCLIEGFGGGKDKFRAAQYLRLAEKKGSSQVGNSWIWKDKYNPR